MGPKILVSDFDGTLAYDDRIPEAVSRALTALVDSGWDLILATGRIFASVRPHLPSLPTTKPLILYDGARIVSTQGEVLHERLLASATASEALRLGWEAGLEIQVFGDEEILVPPGDGASTRYFRRVAVPIREDLTEPVVDNDVYRVIFYGDPGRVRRLAEHLREGLGAAAAAVTLAGDTFLDVLAPGVSKGAALERLLAATGRPERLVCAGDHHNDRELLLLADLAAVPDDADEDLREISHFTFPSASKGGFVDLVRELLRSDPFIPVVDSEAGQSCS